MIFEGTSRVNSLLTVRRVDKEIPVRLGGMNREQRPKKKPKAKPETDDIEEEVPKKKR
jgi:hypothetical protein